MSQAVKNEFIKWLDARYLDTISSTYLKMMDAAEDFSKANGLTELSIYDFSVPDYFEALSTDILQLLANTEITDENYLKMKAAFEHFSEFIAGDGKVSEDDEVKIREILKEDDEKREAREQKLEEERLQREKEKEEMLKLFSSVTQVEEERDVQVEMPEESAESAVTAQAEETRTAEIPAEDVKTQEETAAVEAQAAENIVTEEEASPEPAVQVVEAEAAEVEEAPVVTTEAETVRAEESPQEVTVIDETTEALGSEETENEKEFEAFLTTTGEGEDEDFDFEASLQKKPSEEIQDSASDDDLLSFFDALDIHPLDDEDDEDVPVSAQEVPVIEEEEVDEEAIITNFFNEIGVNREDFLSNAREFPSEEESVPVAEEAEAETATDAVPAESGIEAGAAAAGAAAVTEAAIDYAPLEEGQEPEAAEEETPVEEAAVEDVSAEDVPEEVPVEEESEAQTIEAAPAQDAAEDEDENEDNTDFFDAMVTPEEKASLGYVAFHADHVSTINGSSVQAVQEPEVQAEDVTAEETTEEAPSEGATFPEGDAVTAAAGVAAAAAVGAEAENSGSEEAADVSDVDIDKLASVDLDDLDFSAADDLFAAFATEIPAEAEVGYIPYKAERTSCDLTPAEETEAPAEQKAAPKKRNAVHLAALRKKRREAAKARAKEAPAKAQPESAKTLGYVPFSSYPPDQAESAQETLSLQAPEEEKALPAPEGAEAENAAPDVIEMGGTIALGGVVSSMMLEDQRAGQELLEEPEKPLAIDGDTKQEAIPVGGTIAMGGDIALGEAEEGTGAPSYDMSPEAGKSEESGETVVSVETAEKESRKTFGDFGRHDLPRPLSFSIGNRTPIEVEDWQDLYVKLINELIPLDRQKLSALLEYTSGEQIYRKPKMLRSGHIIESDLSERTILKNISAILKLCSVDSDSIRLTLEDTEETEE